MHFAGWLLLILKSFLLASFFVVNNCLSLLTLKIFQEYKAKNKTKF